MIEWVTMLISAGLIGGAPAQASSTAEPVEPASGGNWTLVMHGHHPTLVVHGRQAPPMDGLPMVIPGAYEVIEPLVAQEVMLPTEFVERPSRKEWQQERRADIARRHGAEPRQMYPLWKYTPKKDWSYTPPQRQGYEPLNRSNYTPKRSFEYHPQH